MSTEEKLSALRSLYSTRAASRFDRWLKLGCESPIEQLLLAQMAVDGWGDEHPFLSWRDTYEIARESTEDTRLVLACDDCACIAALQAKVELGPHSYRIDFAFLGHRTVGEAKVPVRVAIELDGHDFHERTKQQASRDKKRDRVLSASGWTVLRFTGSDVYADPAKVLDEIVTYCNRVVFDNAHAEAIAEELFWRRHPEGV